VKKALTFTLLLAALALCGVSVAQWLREAAFREEITSLTAQLQAENELRIAIEEKAAAFEQEIARLTQLRADTEARLLEVTDELTRTQADQLHRGYSIAVLAAELMQCRTSADRAEKRLADTIAVLNAQDGGGQKEALTTANTRLKALTAERDQAIAELNARTKAYNELVAKYNKLVN
jgi:septal ring factor EnvC (AmiA/AmiB activator)